MNTIKFLEEWSNDYKLLQQKILTRNDLAIKYNKTVATIGNWIKCYEQTKLPYKTLYDKWNNHGVKINGIRKFMRELHYHFNNSNNTPAYIYYNEATSKIWFQTEPTAEAEPYFVLKAYHNMYLSEIYNLIFKKIDASSHNITNF